MIPGASVCLAGSSGVSPRFPGERLDDDIAKGRYRQRQARNRTGDPLVPEGRESGRPTIAQAPNAFPIPSLEWATGGTGPCGPGAKASPDRGFFG